MLDCKSVWKVILVLAGVLLAWAGGRPALGQCEMAQLVPANPEEFATISQAGAIDGDYIVAGDPNGGGFYVFHRSGTTWVEVSNPSGPPIGIQAAAISGDYIVIGNQTDGDAGNMAGAAHVFRRTGDDWIEVAKLIAGDAAEQDQFGASVAIDGDYVVVGQNRHLNFDSPGSVYVFRRDDMGTPNDPADDVWIEQAKLTASDGPADNNRFGRSVSISGDAILVGAYRDFSGANTGAAYVYRRTNTVWTEEAKLTAGDAEAGDIFGFSVSLSGDDAVIGAPWHDGAGDYSGVAYVFRWTDGAWQESVELIAQETAPGDEFGHAVAIQGDHIVVGAPFRGGGFLAPGAAYVFSREGVGWIETGKLVPSDPGLNVATGVAVAVDGDYAIVADAYPYDDIPDRSSAYVFAIAGDCNETDTPDICDILDGTSDDANDDGVPDECESISIVSSDPPDGAIDARQPSEPDGANPTGWSEVLLTFDGDTSALTVEDFTITLDPPGVPPILAFVFPAGNDAVLQFGDFAADPIPPGHWTIITHNASESSVRLGYLPADVNNDKLSNANDVLFLIDVLNGVISPAPPAYQTDTDRSGATNGNDVLRVIDLLNGAGVYDEYLNAELPA